MKKPRAHLYPVKVYRPVNGHCKLELITIVEACNLSQKFWEKFNHKEGQLNPFTGLTQDKKKSVLHYSKLEPQRKALKAQRQMDNFFDEMVMTRGRDQVKERGMNSLLWEK